MEKTIIEQTGPYNVITKNGVGYVLRELDRKGTGFLNPNFMDSGMALRGILQPGETIKQFIRRDKLKTLRPIENSN